MDKETLRRLVQEVLQEEAGGPRVRTAVCTGSSEERHHPVHHQKVADAPQEDKDMENFMAADISSSDNGPNTPSDISSTRSPD